MRQLLLWPVATSDNLVASAQIARRWSRRFEPEILVGRRVGVAPDQVDPGLLDPRTDAPDERELIDRYVGHAIVEDLLDLVQQRLPVLRVELARLTLEEVLDLGNHAGGVDPPCAHVRLEARGGVTASAGNADDHVLELSLAPRRRHGSALHGLDPGLDADGLHVAGER